MIKYLFRRLAYALPIILVVNFLTFALFFMVNTPEDMARMQLGAKYENPALVQNWIASKGYDKPLFFNGEHSGLSTLTDTVFYEKSLTLLVFDFGLSDAGRSIGADIYERMWPSLAIAVPSFVVGLWVNISVALMVLLFRATRLETGMMVAAVTLMSISGLFYIIMGQYLMSKLWHWFPISGYADGLDMWKFLVLPVIIGVIAGMGAGVRWYRTLFLEELGQDYVRTAYAKGLSETRVLFGHILRNALIPILTGVVVVIPALFMGSLIMESFFAIPGLGSYTLDAIQSQDFAIVRVMVFVGTLLYIAGLILTDLAYALVDPRVRL
jgi:peptide/nickel transport system permease protein